MMIKTLFCWILLTLGWAYCDEQCMVQNLQGTCIPITSCQFAMSILSINDVQTLRSLFCGFEGRTPKVCCPTTDKTEKSTTTTTKNPIPTVVYVTTNRYEPEQKDPALEIATLPPAPTTRDPFILPDRDVCGQVTSSNRIYGGSIAEIDEFPWMARIKMYKPTNRKELYICSGSLISDRYVVTAAHCVTVYKVIGVRLGEWDTETEIDCENDFCNDGPLDVKTDKIIIHPNYSRETLSGDIALLRLEEPVTFTDFIRPICLPTSEYIARQDYIDSTYTTAGWGKTEFGQASVVLRKVNLDYVPYSICSSTLPYLQKTEDPLVICAGGKQSRDTCQGDSGGPLFRVVHENFKHNWFLYGVTSYGVINCGTDGKPSVYTRVSKYMDWIRETISGG